MKIDKIPDSIDPTLNLEQIREECLELVKKRSYVSAGAAVVPVPFFDVVIDVGMLSFLIPEINARCGFEFSGLVVARTAVKASFNNMAAKIITKQVTKFIPLGGSIIAASLGYIVMKKVAETHVDECYKLAKGIQQKQQASVVKYS